MHDARRHHGCEWFTILKERKPSDSSLPLDMNGINNIKRLLLNNWCLVISQKATQDGDGRAIIISNRAFWSMEDQIELMFIKDLQEQFRGIGFYKCRDEVGPIAFKTVASKSFPPQPTLPPPTAHNAGPQTVVHCIEWQWTIPKRIMRCRYISIKMSMDSHLNVRGDYFQSTVIYGEEIKWYT